MSYLKIADLSFCKIIDKAIQVQGGKSLAVNPKSYLSISFDVKKGYPVVVNKLINRIGNSITGTVSGKDFKLTAGSSVTVSNSANSRTSVSASSFSKSFFFGK